MRPGPVGRFDTALVIGAFVALLAVPFAAASPGVGRPAPPSAGGFSVATEAPSAAPAIRAAVTPTIWRNLTTSVNPGLSTGAAVAYDPNLGGLLMYGGFTGPSGQSGRSSTWAYVDGAWENLSGSVGTGPPSDIAIQGALSYSPLRGADIFYGGRGLDSSQFPQYSATWEFRNGSWGNITDSVGTGPGELAAMETTFDAADGYTLLFGGSPSYAAGTFSNATWALGATGGWVPEGLDRVAPPGRVGFSMVYDAASQQVVLFGGRDPGFTDFNDTWVYHAGVWRSLTLPIAPSPRISPSMVYDPSSQYVVLYGGCGQTPSIGGCERLNDTWIFRNDTWTNITTNPALNVTPGPIVSFDGAWDSAMNGAVFAGGGVVQANSSEDLTDTTWEFAWPALSVRLAADRSGIWVPGNVSFTPTVYGGAVDHAGTSYSGLPTNCTTSTSTPFGCRFTAPGTYPITLTVAGVTNSTGSSTVVVYAGYPASVTLRASPGPLAVDRPFELTASAAGGTGVGISFEYSGLTGVCALGNTTVVTCDPDDTGTFNVTVTYSDDGGEVASAPLSLEIDPTPSVSLTAHLLGARTCGVPPDEYELSAVVAGGSAPYDYLWTYGDGTPTVAGPATVDHTYSQFEDGRDVATLQVIDARDVSVNVTVNVTESIQTCTPAGGSPGSIPTAEYLLWGGIGAGIVAAIVVGARVLRRSRPPAAVP